MKLVVGLGNPGARYEGTRHNLGYEVVRLVARLLGVQRFRRGRLALLAADPRSRLIPGGFTLLLPTTYMNASGLAVAATLGRRARRREDIIVVHDDLDLPTARLRLRAGGSSGGHLGVASIIEELGTDDFARVRIGIGRPPDGADAVGYVLERPEDDEERRALEAAVARAAEAVVTILRDGLEAAMNVHNRTPGNDRKPGSDRAPGSERGGAEDGPASQSRGGVSAH